MEGIIFFSFTIVTVEVNVVGCGSVSVHITQVPSSSARDLVVLIFLSQILKVIKRLKLTRKDV